MTHSFPTRRSSELKRLADGILHLRNSKAHLLGAMGLVPIFPPGCDLTHIIEFEHGADTNPGAPLILRNGDVIRPFKHHMVITGYDSMWRPAFQIATQGHLLFDIVNDGLRTLHRRRNRRSEEHTYELQSLMRISYAVFCLKKKDYNQHTISIILKFVIHSIHNNSLLYNTYLYTNHRP